MDKGGVEKEPEIIKFVSATLDPKGEKFRKTTYTVDAPNSGHQI